jgi:outer membrane protein insertion porin family
VRLRMLLALLAGLASASGQGVPAVSWEGRTISRIEYDPQQQPLPRNELDRLLPLRPGAALSMEDVRSAIQKLYLTGRYADIAIDANADGPNVAIQISTEFNYFISRVNIQGQSDPPTRNQLVTSTKLDLGTLFDEMDLDQAEKNMRELLQSNGLYQTQIAHHVDLVPDTEEASIYFDLTTRDRARFDGVDLTGQFTRSKDSIIRATGWHRSLGLIPLWGWREVTDNRVQTGLQRLRQDYQKSNHLRADVTLTSREYHPDTNTVTPHLTINSGPVTEVRITGAKVGGSQLRELLPIYQERAVDTTLLREGQLNLREYFQSKGYFDAMVDPPLQSESLIQYNVSLGDRHKLKLIDIQGNSYFDTETLRERMYIEQATFLRSRYGRFSQRWLEQDRNSILDLYHSNGFRDAEIPPPQIEDGYGGKPNDLAVHLRILEGPQWLVNRLDLDGVPAEDLDYLRSILRSIEGQPFSEANVAADRDTVLSYYYNNGYPDATFDSSWQDAAEPNRVNVHYTVTVGKRQFVRGILVRGLDTTNPSLVESRISLAPGDPISQSRIGESQQRLYDLGIFSKVQTALQNPDGQEDSKYVLFHLDETARYSFNFGVGAEFARIGGGTTTFESPAGQSAFSPRVSVGVSRINFLGLGHTVSLQTLASTLEQRALLSYLAPQFKGNEDLALSFSALFDDSKDVRTFTARRWEGSVQLSDRLSLANTLQFRYTFRNVYLDRNSLKISPVLIPLLSQSVRVGLVSGSFVQDRRDDPIDTHRGIYNSADLGLAWKGFGSETDFTRLLLRNSTYYTIGRDLVVARSLQFGYIQRLGGLPLIPLAERFYSGGPSSQRAFPNNQAGPRDTITGFPLGGSALVLHQTELRFPLIGNSIGGVLFHDLGNVYSSVDSISFRFRQKNLEDFDYAVQAVGFGIRIRTPAGPLRFDLSASPNTPKFFGFNGTRDQLLAINPNEPDFCKAARDVGADCTNQRISRFQFQFSLGPTF